MFYAKLYQIFNRYKSTFYYQKNCKKLCYITITIRPIIFFKSVIGQIEIFGGANSYFCILNFENIEIIVCVYIYIYILKKLKVGGEGGMAPHPITYLRLRVVGFFD